MTETADETTTPRCRTCGRHEVAAHTWDCPACVNAARQDIRQIAKLYATLPEEVEHRGVESQAMHLLGPASDPEARGHLEASVAAGRVSPEMLEDGTGSHPLLALATLSMIVRDALGHDEPDGRATVEGEAAYLDGQLTTLSHDLWFDFRDLKKSVERCRKHLESVLYAGDQEEQGAPCPGDEHEMRKPPKLEKHYGNPVDGSRDEWRCPVTRCGKRWSERDYRLFVADVYAAKAKALTAADLEKYHDVKPGTVRQWAMRKQVRKRGRDGQGRQMYDVADVLAAKGAVAA